MAEIIFLNAPDDSFRNSVFPAVFSDTKSSLNLMLSLARYFKGVDDSTIETPWHFFIMIAA
jgi:hypothetical protein